MNRAKVVLLISSLMIFIESHHPMPKPAKVVWDPFLELEAQNDFTLRSNPLDETQEPNKETTGASVAEEILTN